MVSQSCVQGAGAGGTLLFEEVDELLEDIEELVVIELELELESELKLLWLLVELELIGLELDRLDDELRFDDELDDDSELDEGVTELNDEELLVLEVELLMPGVELDAGVDELRLEKIELVLCDETLLFVLSSEGDPPQAVSTANRHNKAPWNDRRPISETRVKLPISSPAPTTLLLLRPVVVN